MVLTVFRIIVTSDKCAWMWSAFQGKKLDTLCELCHIPTSAPVLVCCGVQRTVFVTAKLLRAQKLSVVTVVCSFIHFFLEWTKSLNWNVYVMRINASESIRASPKYIWASPPFEIGLLRVPGAAHGWWISSSTIPPHLDPCPPLGKWP